MDHSPVERPSGHRLQGVVLVAISAAGFATIGLFARVAAASGASTLSVLALRFLLAGALLVLVMHHRQLP